jgi:hypothetical protein
MRTWMSCLLVLAACGTPPVSPTMGKNLVPSGRVPMQHRAAADACPTDRPPGTCALHEGVVVSCTADGECADAGANSRCNMMSFSVIVGCACTHDACSSDSDCATPTGACLCDQNGNRCVSGNCRVDADCGPGRSCSPSFGDCGFWGGFVGYYCHVPDDSCVDDSDCPSTNGLPAAACIYQPTVSAWRCATPSCQG